MAMDNYIKTKCGHHKLERLNSNNSLIGKIRLWWFLVIGSIRDNIAKL